jgi:DNA-binding CsgD family transcriptional regulator
MGAVVARRQDQTFPTLTSLRGRPKGEYGEDDRRVAKFLLPYLSQAWTIYERLEVLAAGEAVLDKLPLGVIFVRDGGVTVCCNRCADEILCADDGLTLRNHQLSPRSRTADAQLQRSIAHVLRPTDHPPAPRVILVPRTSCRRPYQLSVAPLRSGFTQFAGTPAPRAVVFVTDPERPRPGNRDLLIQLFGLTRKEADMSVKLSEAKSIEQAAEEMGITYETARTHLRRIFSKTGTSRQTELLLLLARLPYPDEE